MECSYCKHTFKSKWSLKTHQNTTKYCLAIQNKNNTLFTCTFCDVSVSTKQRLNTHMSTCSANSDKVKKIIDDKNKTIQKLQEQVSTLQAELSIYKKMSESATACVEEIAKQPKITNTQNNISNKWINVGPLALFEDKNEQQRVGAMLKESFSDDHYNAGQKGLARWTHENLLKDKTGTLLYKCTNTALDVYKYMDSWKNIRKDVRANQLTEILGDQIKPVTKERMTQMVDNFGTDGWDVCYANAQELNDVKENNGVFRQELRSLTSR
uniref:C2H2-type domain-containing protein n=1 Tax=viral metagenome TaxID=1070528 RepID=A0A6C0JT34_9ZZZZ